MVQAEFGHDDSALSEVFRIFHRLINPEHPEAVDLCEWEEIVSEEEMARVWNIGMEQLK